MSSKGLRIVWFYLHNENGKKVRLFFPITVNVFRELLDSVLDIVEVICIFVPQRSTSSSRFSVHTLKQMIIMLIELFSSITDDGPYDLVNVTANNVKVSIKVR